MLRLWRVDKALLGVGFVGHPDSLHAVRSPRRSFCPGPVHKEGAAEDGPWYDEGMSHRPAGFGATESDRGRYVCVSVRTVTFVLAGIAVALLVAGLTVEFVRHGGGEQDAFGLVQRFGLDEENSVPTFFMTTLLLGVSLLLVAVAHADKSARTRAPRRWLALGLLSLLMAMDEASSFHELLTYRGQESFGASGIFHYAWVVPGAIAAALVVAYNWRFINAMPRPTRDLLGLAVVLYVCGALGVEAISGAYAESRGQDNLAYSGLVAVEESLEMAGLITAVYALLQHLQWSLGSEPLRVIVGAGQVPSRRARPLSPDPLIRAEPSVRDRPPPH